jgi:hypothetical protein
MQVNPGQYLSSFKPLTDSDTCGLSPLFQVCYDSSPCPNFVLIASSFHTG